MFKNKIIITLMVISVLLLGLCKKYKKEDKDYTGLGLLYLLLSSNTETNNSSGFMLKIPDGVAK